MDLNADQRAENGPGAEKPGPDDSPSSPPDPAYRRRKWIGTATDIQDLKLAQESAQRNEAMLRAVLDQIPSGVTVRDADTGDLILSNARSLEIMGSLTPNPGQFDDYRGFHPDGRPYRTEEWPVYRSMATGEAVEAEEIDCERADGTRIALRVSSVPVRDPQTGRPWCFATVTRDVTEQKRLEQSLRDADRRKNELLATLAHELRNPLAPIRNAVEILRLKGPPDPTLESARTMIDRQLTHLIRLIDDLLDLSRIDRGRLQVRRERVALAEVLERALESSRPRLELAHHTLQLSLPPEPVWLDADPIRLAQAFQNLLDNACKYTEPGGRIGLCAERDEAGLAVRIADSGIGIEPEHLPGVFETFSQMGSTLERSQGGLGIGLALARGLVEMHGGTIEARSAGPGQGSEFIVRLPALPHAPAAQPPCPSARACGEPVAARRILVVDDNRDIVDSLALLLRLVGNQVETAGDGLAAVEAAGRYRPDLILLDIGMPRLDGYSACRQIRAQPWGRGMAIVALTGWGQEEDRRRSREAGFDGHLVKPVEPSALIALLAEERLNQWRSLSPDRSG